ISTTGSASGSPPTSKAMSTSPRLTVGIDPPSSTCAPDRQRTRPRRSRVRSYLTRRAPSMGTWIDQLLHVIPLSWVDARSTRPGARRLPFDRPPVTGGRADRGAGADRGLGRTLLHDIRSAGSEEGRVH